MTFDITQLDEFSGGFARALFAAHPDWVCYARLEIADDGETPDLIVEVPSPHSANGANGLMIYTEDFEVTISFAFYHNHFNWPVPDVDKMIDPLAVVAAILNEDVAAASSWNDDKWCGSWLVDRGEQIAPPNKFSPGNCIRVRSWNGALDQDLPTA